MSFESYYWGKYQVSKLKDMFNKWRKASVFPSINEIEWRHNELAARLKQIHDYQVKDDLPITGLKIETQKNILELLAYIQPMKILNANKVRLGSAGDGGYVQLNDLNGITLGLSFGIKDDDSWDLEIASKGITVQQFDYTVDRSPSSHPLLSFNKKKISGVTTEGSISLQDLIKSHRPSSGPDIILKIDIEGSEWEVFDNCAEEQLSKIKQILCEFHGLSRLNDCGFYTLAHRVLKKLNKHFIPYHVHGNNAANIVNIANVTFPDVIEVSFANRASYSYIESNDIYPTDLDSPNVPELPDIFLGQFQFSSSK